MLSSVFSLSLRFILKKEKLNAEGVFSSETSDFTMQKMNTSEITLYRIALSIRIFKHCETSAICDRVLLKSMKSVFHGTE